MQQKISKNFVELILNQTPLGIGPLAIALFGIKFLQEKILYIPNIDGVGISEENPYLFRSPSSRQLSYDIISIKHDSIELKGWFIKQQNPEQCRTMIFMHENAGNLGYRLDYFEKYYHKVGCNIVAVAYRGYDESTGSPNQIGIQKDAIAIIRYVFGNLKIDKNNVYIHGRSLGGAVAIYAAIYCQDSKKEQIKAVIVENTFTSIIDVVNDLVPNLTVAKHLFTRNQWNSFENIKKIRIPMFFILSGKDELVPCSQMNKLYELADKSVNKQMYLIPEGEHNDNWTIDQNYFNQILEYITSLP